MKWQVQELQDDGLIWPSCPPVGSPITYQKKTVVEGCSSTIKHWTRLLITTKTKYPLPRIDDLLDQLKYPTYFSKLMQDDVNYAIM